MDLEGTLVERDRDVKQLEEIAAALTESLENVKTIFAEDSEMKDCQIAGLEAETLDQAEVRAELRSANAQRADRIAQLEAQVQTLSAQVSVFEELNRRKGTKITALETPAQARAGTIEALDRDVLKAHLELNKSQERLTKDCGDDSLEGLSDSEEEDMDLSD